MPGAQMVTFRLGDETYGLDISQIREVLNIQEVTALPHLPKFVKGVISLRGQVVPVVDLREKLGMSGGTPRRPRILVLDLPKPLGILVDDVSRVLKSAEGRYSTVPELLSEDRDASLVEAIFETREGGLVVMLAAARILSKKEEKAVSQAVCQAAR